MKTINLTTLKNLCRHYTLFASFSAIIFFFAIGMVSAQPTAWQSSGVGGGGALFSPSINPQNDNEYFMACDMSQLFHTNDFGAAYNQVSFVELFGGPRTKVYFTNDPNVCYTLHVDAASSGHSPIVSNDGGQTWSPIANDPTFGDAYYFLANPNNLNQLLLTDYYNLYFSNDGGNTFSLKYTTAEGGGLYIAGAFWDGSNIYIGTSIGLLQSSTGGTTFALSTATGLPVGNTIYSFSGAKAGGVTRLFALTAVNDDIWSGIHPNDYWGHANGIYSLDVGAMAWLPKSAGINFANEFPIFLGMAQNDINTVYIAGGSNGSGPYCKKTNNAGSVWNNVFLTNNNQNIATGNAGQGGHNNWGWVESFFGLDVAATNSNKAVLTDWGYVHTTTNGGTTWEQKYCNAADQHAPNTLIDLADTYQSVGMENTTSWQVFWTDANNLWACFSDISGLKSNDSGVSWSYNYSGLTENTSYRVVKNTANNTLYVATSSVHDLYQSTRLADTQLDAAGNAGAIKYSTDNGSTWQMLHDFSEIVCWVATDPTNANRLYASVVNSSPAIGGIWVSNNINLGSASTWTKLPNPPRTEGHPFNIMVLNTGDLVVSYSGHRDPAFTASSGVFLYNATAGTWADRSHPGMYYWTKDVIVAPNDATQSTWYACVFSGWGGAPNGLGGLYKTTDKGISWTRIWNSDRVGSCTINPNNPDEMYCTTEIEGLWYSNNLSTATPTFVQLSEYLFKQPERVFFNPYSNTGEIWVTSFGNGMKVSATCVPPTPVISGNNAVCNNSIQTYSVAAVAGDSYLWTVTGGTILSGQGTNSISVQWSTGSVGTVVVEQVGP